MRVVGLDLSMTGTGYAFLQTPDIGPGGYWHLSTIATKGTNEDPVPVTHKRLRAIRDELARHLLADVPDLVVLEGPAFSSSTGKAHDRSGLWWLVYDYLAARGYPVAVVKPNTRITYAIGKGSGSKDTVLAAAIRRYPQAAILNNNEADAVVLAAMGARFLEWPVEDNLPVTHLRAMTAPEWPALAAV